MHRARRFKPPMCDANKIYVAEIIWYEQSQSDPGLLDGGDCLGVYLFGAAHMRFAYATSFSGRNPIYHCRRPSCDSGFDQKTILA